ncbi:hypothetical protein AB0H28_10265 [Micromonospora sp. NPDC050980]|uniref:hypothetical protein n=1 Tax=Micromonospora sp. NPDC050980 TaxID=3155161 RepID=UPI003404C378
MVVVAQLIARGNEERNRVGRTVAGGACRIVRQGAEDALPQKLVLPPAPPGSVRGTSLHLGADDNLPPVELVRGEVDLVAAGQPVPVVPTDLGVSDEHLAEHQFTAEEVLDDERGDTALATGRVAGVPGRQVVRVTGVRSPTRPHHRPQPRQSDHRTIFSDATLAGRHP